MSDTVSTVSPSIPHEVMGPDALILGFWMLSFKPTLSLSSFTFIRRLFSSSSLLFHLALCDSHGPLTTLLSAPKFFPLFLLQRQSVKDIITWFWSLVGGTQLTISWDPEMSSLVLCFCPFFSNQIQKAKSLKNINVIITLSRPLRLPDLFGASKREHIPFIQAGLRPQTRSARGSLRKHKTLI